ncbi:TIGR01620 family protein [Pseudomonadales bacterium]|nr:TIGR01620 family protein [Pseudomonadales bacterium]
MSGQQDSPDKPEGRKEGRMFDPRLTVSEAADDERLAKTFTPLQSETLTAPPESITAGQRLPQVPEYSGISLEALPIKGFKSFTYGLGILVLSMFGWEAYGVFSAALSTHWALAVGFTLLVVIVTGLGVHSVRGFLSGCDSPESVEIIRGHMARLSQGNDFGHAGELIAELKSFYSDKPQAVYLQRCLESLPDYCNDQEAIVHLERAFIEPLDQEALRRIGDMSLQSCIVVAVSPWATVDMMLALWRSMKLIDEVAQVYGIRPSLRNRYKLLRLVIHQLAFVGASEVLVDELLEEMGSVSLVSQFSAKIAQGLGAGIYTAKIGLAAMYVSRPVEFCSEKPKLSSLITPLVGKVKRHFSIKSESL